MQKPLKFVFTYKYAYLFNIVLYGIFQFGQKKIPLTFFKKYVLWKLFSVFLVDLLYLKITYFSPTFIPYCQNQNQNKTS